MKRSGCCYYPFEKGVLDTQHDGIDEWAIANTVTITVYFHDDGVSGTILDRNRLTELLSVLAKGNHVVFLKYVKTTT